MRVQRYATGLAVLVAMVIAPASAPAQSGDPAQGSPSGVIYEIPLENARRDAAPGRGGVSRRSGSPDSGAGAPAGSPIRSENGFGSSSTVPGSAGSAEDQGAGGSSDDESGAGGSGSGGSGSGGSGAGGSGAAGDGAGTAPGDRVAGPAAAAITPSKSRAYLLLVLALAVAAGIGVAGRYVTQKR